MTNGDDVLPVLITREAIVAVSNRNIARDSGKIAFLGTHKYKTKLKKAVVLASIIAIRSTVKDFPMAGLPLKKVQKYSAKIDIDIKKDASQIRRCQKRFISIGLIVVPYFLAYDLLAIMTIMVEFYKGVGDM